MAKKHPTELTKEQCEELLGEPISDSLWSWIVTHNRQPEIIDQYKYERVSPQSLKGWNIRQHFIDEWNE